MYCTCVTMCSTHQVYTCVHVNLIHVYMYVHNFKYSMVEWSFIIIIAYINAHEHSCPGNLLHFPNTKLFKHSLILHVHVHVCTL